MIRAKHGDTKPVQVTLRRGSAVIDLTDAWVDYHLKQRPGEEEVSGECVVAEPLAGIVQFPVPPEPGRYDAEWEITDSNDEIETIPNGQPEVLLVSTDLA